MSLNEILEPYEYLVKNPGKDFRSQLIAAFDIWLKVPLEKQKIISDVIAMLHTSSLLYLLITRIDDVQDGSELRRGLPVAHKIYGVAKTINAGNYIYFEALRRTMELGSMDVIQVFTHELLQLHLGQGSEIHWRDTVECPTEAEYLQMVSNKTGGLLRLAVKLMQGNNTSTKYVELVDLLGIHFQIRDDYVNLYHDAKGFAEDLTEGKFSFPIVNCVRNHAAQKSVILSILRQRTNDVDVKKYAISLLRECGSLEYTRQYLLQVESKALDLIKDMGGNPILEHMLLKLSSAYKS